MLEAPIGLALFGTDLRFRWVNAALTRLDGRAEAERLARDLLATLDEPILVRGQAVFADASIGIAVYPDDGTGSEALRAVSDSAMYAIKRKNRRERPESRAAV